MPNGDKKTHYRIDHEVGARSWSFANEFDYLSVALKEFKKLREENKHRDDKIHAETRPCTIWTSDGTWASYRSVPTNYRLIEITETVIDEDLEFDRGNS